MSATPATIVRPELARWPAGFARLIGACWYGMARHFARRTAIKALSELDDRALRDIGLLRCQIEAAVHGFMSNTDRARM